MVESVSEIIAKINPKQKDPLAEHKLIYDSSSETLEPIYFYILDLLGDFGFQLEKLVDNFTSSPGSGHFAELGQRATIMQQQGSKLLGDINTVLRSILNIIYDLRDFKLRLQLYDDLKNDKLKEAALLSMKQLWMDKVDINKGNSSIKAMALGQAGFQTLIDAFLVVSDESLKGSNGKEIDLNERVKRIVRSRIIEFNHWVGESENELRRRYKIEKTYLKSQVNSLKIYSRWARPYLKAAQELEMNEKSREPALVKAFNTIILELTILGKRKVNVKDEALAGNLPRDFQNIKNVRDYYNCILVDLNFRGIPQRAGQQPHYVFGGKTEVSFKAYALNEDELKKLNEELEESDLGDALKLIEGATTESIENMQEEINYFLEEKEDESKSSSGASKKEESSDSSNPFKALFGGYNKKPEKKKESSEKKKEKVVIRKENFAEEQYIRPFAAETIKDNVFAIFDIYKKAHGMVSYT
ncbi:MAG: hypothetical protein Q8P81_02880 [Nanoarchaeota archaeon]|nr:hypothetical protein [Nanoarchaeota archaeon]